MSEESRTQQIHALLKEIRECDLCELKPRYTPCVYGSEYSKILVVSWEPSKGEYEGRGGKCPLGDVMASSMLSGREPPFWTCNYWLGKSEPFSSRDFFWIHRANCAGGNRQQCSCKFLERAIGLVRPQAIFIFGGAAADYFFPKQKYRFPNKRMLHLVRSRDLTYTQNRWTIKCQVFFHWSRRNRCFRWEEHRAAHQESVKVLHTLVNELRSTSASQRA